MRQIVLRLIPTEMENPSVERAIDILFRRSVTICHVQLL